jgi:uncharacterized protein DUF4340
MNMKTTLILLVIVALLAVGVLLIEGEQTAPKVNRSLFEGFLSTDVRELSWSAAGNAPVVVKRTEDGWRVVVAGTEVPASETSVLDVLGELDRGRVERRLPAAEVDAARREEFLLAPPAHWISFVMRDETRKLFMGAPGQMRDTCYAQRAGDDDVLLIDDSLLETLVELDADSLRSREILNWSVYDVGGLEVLTPEGTMFKAVRDPEENTLWTAEVPFTGYVDPEIMESALLADVLKLEATDFVKDGATAEDLAAFGLDDPRFTIRLAQKGNPNLVHTMLIGDEIPDRPGFSWFMEEGRDFVYAGRAVRVSALLAQDPQTWRDGNLTRLGWKAVGGFKVRFDDVDFEVEKVHGDWHLVKPERMLLDQPAVEDWFQRAREWSAAGFVDNPDLVATGLDEPRGEVAFWPPAEGKHEHGAEGAEAELVDRAHPVVRILVGGAAPDKDLVFVLRAGDVSTAFEMGPEFVAMLSEGYYPFKRAAIFDDDLSGRQIERVVRSFEGTEEDLRAVDRKWPEGTNTAALNGVVSKLFALAAVRWVGPAEGKLEEYGLAGDPALSLRVHTKDGAGNAKDFGVDIGR